MLTTQTPTPIHVGILSAHGSTFATIKTDRHDMSIDITGAASPRAALLARAAAMEADAAAMLERAERIRAGAAALADKLP